MSHSFTYESLVVEILSVNPNTGPTSGGTTIQIVGRGFIPPGAGGAFPTVQIDGTAVTVTAATDQLITVTTLAHAAGAVDVTVTASGLAAVTLVDGFTYRDPSSAPPIDLVFRSPSGGANRLARTENAPAKISQTLGQPANCTFTTPQEPHGLDGVAWACFGQTLFDGLITKSTARSDGAQKVPVWDCDCHDNTWVLSKRYPTGDWKSVSASTVLTTLMAQFGGGFQSQIESGLPLVTVNFDGGTDLWAAVIQVCELAGAHAFVAGITLHVFTLDSGFDPPAAVTDDNPDLQWPEQGQAVTLELDYSQLVNSVTVNGAAGVFAIVEDGGSIREYGRLPFPINDNNLTTQDECVRRGQQFLKQHAQPVPTAKYATRDLKTMAGKTVLIAVSVPAIDAQFIISNCSIDQVENLASGGKPRFMVTAVPAWAPAMIRSDPTERVLQTAVDLANNANKQPKLDGDVVSAPGGRTTIPPGTVAASQLAGCIDSTKMSDTPVVPGPYPADGWPPPTTADAHRPKIVTGHFNHLIGVTVDNAGRVTAAAEDPVAVVKVDGSQPFTADQPVGGHKFTGAADPTNPQDVATKAYVDAHAGAAAGGDIRSDGTVAFAADQSMGAHRLTNVTDPTGAQDAATKAYVDGHVAGVTPSGPAIATEVTRSTAQNFASGTPAAISFDAATYDTSGMWSATAPTRLTATVATRYYVHGEITLGVGLAGVVHLRVRKNGATILHAQTAVAAEVASGTERHTVDGTADLIAGDYLEIVAELDLLAGASFNVTGALAEVVAQAQAGPPGPTGPAGPAPVAGGASSYASTSQSISNLVETAITLNVNTFDRGGYWFSGTPTRLTVPPGKAGVYAIEGQAKWSLGSGTGGFYTRLYKNGVTLLAEAFDADTVPDPANQVSALVQLADGDYVELKVYQNTGGAQATVAGSGATYLTLAITGGGGSGGGGSVTVPGHLTISGPAAIVSPVNLTTLGIVDWFTPVNNATPLHLQTTPHKKMFGYGFLEHWWVYGPSGFSSFTATTTTSVSSTASDDATNNPLTNYNSFALIYNSGAGLVGYGWAIRVRARQGSRTLKLGIHGFSGAFTITAHLSDASAPDVSTVFTVAPSASDEKEFTIAYNAASDNEVLTVTCLLTSNSGGGGPNVGMLYGYIF
jgi:hypothetical protein